MSRLLITAVVMSVVALADCLWAQGQLCNGSLGDNIFKEGDFGRGREVIFPYDPYLAPGYRYTTHTPVHDGQYTITNNIGDWWDNWPTWLRIDDNSNDPYGYMMVFNASYEPGIFYEQNVYNVCENTLYEFSADVINLIRRRANDHLMPNVSFLIDNEEMYHTGYIPQDEKWRTVGFTFTTKPGQTTIRLTLRNNAPGGYGNDLALDNISFRACGPIATVDIEGPDIVCEDGVLPLSTRRDSD